MTEFLNKKVSKTDILKYAEKTNKNVALYMLRCYGLDGFSGSNADYFKLMNYLSEPKVSERSC